MNARPIDAPATPAYRVVPRDQREDRDTRQACVVTRLELPSWTIPAVNGPVCVHGLQLPAASRVRTWSVYRWPAANERLIAVVVDPRPIAPPHFPPSTCQRAW